MERISEEIIHDIRKKTDIVDIISSYIPLISRGKNYFGVCPFHDDNHPSMSVSPEKQMYKCFSCGAAGNVFKFVSDYENISFVQAVKMLADRCGIPLEIKNSSSKKTRNEEMYQIYALAHLFYQNNINTKEGRRAREYLQKRNIDDSIIKTFELGLSLKDNTILAKLLESKNFSSQNLEKSGILVRKNYTYKDLYYNRIMFPLWNTEGEVVGFSGRIYEGDDSSKYINTRETEIFKKGELLYNYHRAKQVARKLGKIIIMEGFMDVIRSYTIGLENVIATMGTAVTNKQAHLIKRMAPEVILCFDGDDAGAKATLSCIEELLKIGVTPKIVRLENNLDPDEYILKNGKEKFLEKIENPINVMDFKLRYFKNDKNLNSAEDTAHYINTMIYELSKIDDDILRELTIQKMSEETHLEVDLLKSELSKKRSQKKIEKLPTIQKVDLKKKNYEKAQEYLLYYMLLDKEVIKRYIEAKPFFPTDQYRFLALEIVHFYEQNRDIVIADFMSRVQDNIDINKTLNQILLLDLKEQYSQAEIEDYLKTIADYNIQYEIMRLQKKIKEEVVPSKKAEIARQIVALKQKESKI